MAANQERFFPYLTGYVALYTNDLATAEAELTKALAMQGNWTDPFMHMLTAMTHEKMGHADVAKEWYQKAYDLATAHNPPAAFARPFARKKLGG
jgi:Tfp pilus assembly protein PilF